MSYIKTIFKEEKYITKLTLNLYQQMKMNSKTKYSSLYQDTIFTFKKRLVMIISHLLLTPYKWQQL